MPPAEEKKSLPPEDVIREDSGPPVTETKKPGEIKVDVDDAMIEEPKDDAFEKDGQSTGTKRDRPSTVQSTASKHPEPKTSEEVLP